jgi:hypothetical protein
VSTKLYSVNPPSEIITLSKDMCMRFLAYQTTRETKFLIYIHTYKWNDKHTLKWSQIHGPLIPDLAQHLPRYLCHTLRIAKPPCTLRRRLISPVYLPSPSPAVWLASSRLCFTARNCRYARL